MLRSFVLISAVYCPSVCCYEMRGTELVYATTRCVRIHYQRATTWYAPTELAYAPTRFAVLSERMLLSASECRYDLPDLARDGTMCYAMSGTDLAYGATMCYAMSGTDLAYGATSWSLSR
eukprot:1521024-Rhodomonas_salina.1